MGDSKKKDTPDKIQDFKEPPKYEFKSGEKVLCFHGPLIYEAKCLQSRFDEKQNTPEYRIHYSGWNKNWDEWVPESRVLKFNQDNLLKQKELINAQKELTNKKVKKRSLTGKEGSSKELDHSITPQEDKKQASKKEVSSTVDTSSDNRKKKAKTEATVKKEDHLWKDEVDFKIPKELKSWLFSDCDFLSKSKKLVSLPSKINVESIIDQYLEKCNALPESTQEMQGPRELAMLGVIDYFNAMLGVQLLYPIEKKQYLQLKENHPDKPPSKIYGAIHLVRLFTKFGAAMVSEKLDLDTIKYMSAYVTDFLKYLNNNSHLYFDINNDFISIPDSYVQ